MKCPYPPAYFGQQNESTKKAEQEPGFEIHKNLSKMIIISIWLLGFFGEFGQQ